MVGFAGAFFAVQQFGGNASKTIDTGDKTVHTVDIKKENNQPIDLLIKKGEFVQFNSKDGGEHQIVQGEHSSELHGGNGLIDSGVFKGDEGYLLEFKEIGKFNFHDNLDRDYSITVIVYDPSQSPEDTKIKS